MTTQEFIEMIETSWEKIEDEIKNKNQQKEFLTEDYIYWKDKKIDKITKQFERGVEANQEKINEIFSNIAKKTNKEYKIRLEEEIDSATTIDELNKIQIDDEYNVANILKKSLDARKRFLETEKKIEERKRLEKREDLIRRYMQRGFTKEEAEDIVGD